MQARAAMTICDSKPERETELERAKMMSEEAQEDLREVKAKMADPSGRAV